MASLPSGSRNDIVLVKVDTKEFYLVIKGKPFHYQYEGLIQYRKMHIHDLMEFSYSGDNVNSVLIYDVNLEKLTNNINVRPIFFENGVYQVIIYPKNKSQLEFYHEYPLFRQAITEVDLPEGYLLMGNLHFQNEVGYSTLQIRQEGHVLLELTLEIFPAKLDYRNDYKQLLEEVNDEIYNLAFNFIRKTYLGASLKLDRNPSRVEFYRLISVHFQQFTQALNRIERQPHHKLETTYIKARGDQLGKINTYTRKYLQTKSQYIEVEKGISIHGKTMMPIQGMKIKKELVYDTLENRYVKWMMTRLMDKIEDLILTLYNHNTKWKTEPDAELVGRLSKMKDTLELKCRNPFWRQIGKLDKSVMSLVIQMAPGYRDAFHLYLTVTKGLMLQSKFYQMSVKDVATLYEYWTYLKLGQLLSKKYTMISQDIIKLSRDGLFVNLDSNQKAERIFEHPITKERITLTYQKTETGLPTINQKPDTMLTISKKGKDFTYNYVFDAKYRVDYAQVGSFYKKRYQTPGPLEDDINTMHRYRDSLVYMNNGPYERTSFGAYVLFPWADESGYQEHPLYQSINQVNIGGLPFLPQATDLVEQFVERLIELSPEEINKEGILPRGTKEEWESSLVERVLVGSVSSLEKYKRFIQGRLFQIPAINLKNGWQESKYIALYTTAEVGIPNGIADYGRIDKITSEDGDIIFHIIGWQRTKQIIKPVKYGIASNIITTFNQLTSAKELPELYMKNHQETVIWRMLRRISDEIKVQVNNHNLDYASNVDQFSFYDLTIKLEEDTSTILIVKGNEERTISSELLIRYPSIVFKEVLSLYV